MEGLDPIKIRSEKLIITTDTVLGYTQKPGLCGPSRGPQGLYFPL